MKKLFSILMALCIAFSLSATASAESIPYAGGSGTEEDPYQIATAEQLLALSAAVNDGSVNGYPGVFFAICGSPRGMFAGGCGISAKKAMCPGGQPPPFSRLRSFFQALPHKMKHQPIEHGGNRHGKDHLRADAGRRAVVLCPCGTGR